MSYSNIVESLMQVGFHEFPHYYDPSATKALLDAALSTRRFDRSLFITEDEWEASSKSHKHTNPGPGYNVLEKFPEKLDFLEKDPRTTAFLEHLLGRGYRVLNKRLVCRLPWSQIPDWLQARTRGKPSNAFGGFVYPQYRDISYYMDVDLHQDIQDYWRFPAEVRDPRYITFYVYLGNVTLDDAPIQLLSQSHKFGATPFQHDVRYDAASDRWIYANPEGHKLVTSLKTLTGDAGYAALWHSCLLHGAPPTKDGHFRLSLRYIIARSANPAPCALDDINQTIQGPLFSDSDYTPGANTNRDGFWNLQVTDYVRQGYENVGMQNRLSLYGN